MQAGAPATTNKTLPFNKSYAAGANSAYSSSLEQRTTISAFALKLLYTFFNGFET